MKRAAPFLAIIVATIPLGASALVPLDGVAQIAAASAHTCAVTTSGALKCWGTNSFGELGDGTFVTRRIPVDVVGLGSGVAKTTAGSSHSCALTSAGGVKCWGQGIRLGQNATTSRAIPVDVWGLEGGVAAIAAGSDHTCAITTGGGVKCWGQNTYGQLGDGTTTDRLVPVDVAGLSNSAIALAAGANHTCALSAGGAQQCWGYNAAGQLGDNTTTNRLTPVHVAIVPGSLAMISAGGAHTCGLTTWGAVKCWGYNGSGQLGDNTTTSSLLPIDVAGLTSGATGVTAGNEHTCALTTGGGAKCWGRNTFGQLGDNTSTNRPMPADVAGHASGISAVSAGQRHTCALTTAGGAHCWGYNSSGQLGDDTTPIRFSPVDVTGLASGAAVVSAGGVQTCALTMGGAVKCWGANGFGISETPTTLGLTPVDIAGVASGVTAIATGASHACAVTTGGGVKCWGYNGFGQLGDSSTTRRPIPVDVVGLGNGVNAVSAGADRTCVVTLAGAAKCWGAGQLVPAGVTGLDSGVAAIAAGGSHACALTTGGGVKCWGANGNGRLGDGTTTDRATPVDVVGLTTGVAAIAASYSHSCALTTSSGVKCWGYNGQGQLGNGSLGERTTPADVVGLTSGVSAIAVGSNHTCALTTTGAVQCWGDNTYGQLGDNTIGWRPTPGPVVGLASGAGAISTSGVHTCALVTSGGVKCWGGNTYGQIGDGTAAYRPHPAPVLTADALAITASPPNLDFGGQSMNTTSPAQAITFTNTTGAAITVVSVTASTGYLVSGNNCATLAAGASCQVSVASRPPALGGTIPFNGTLTVNHAGGPTTIVLWGTAEHSLVTHYYRSILRRSPDSAGKAFWEAEVPRVFGLGTGVTEVWFAMAQSFYASPEYLTLNRDNTAFATDLYNTFYNRTPDSSGLAFWKGQLDQGLPREVLLAAFMFSPEFTSFASAIFGNVLVGAEVNVVMDFYRGLLSRLPDNGGFAFWVARFRTAQCQGQAAIVGEVEAISSAFALSAEHAARKRNVAQYVGDLYNAFLRRGGDLQGVQFWINQIATGVQTREQVRVQFKNSPEFQARVNAVVQQGCAQ